MPNVTLSKGVPTDLYVATGISVGTQTTVQNITGNRVRLATSQVELNTDYRVMDQNQTGTNKATDTGAWALCILGDCEVNVRVA